MIHDTHRPIGQRPGVLSGIIIRHGVISTEPFGHPRDIGQRCLWLCISIKEGFVAEQQVLAGAHGSCSRQRLKRQSTIGLTESERVIVAQQQQWPGRRYTVRCKQLSIENRWRSVTHTAAGRIGQQIS